MTQTLKKQLTALIMVSLCGGALMWNGDVLQAQDDDFEAATDPIHGEKEIKRPKFTRDEAAKHFSDALSDIDGRRSYPVGLVSGKSSRELGYQVDEFWRLLATQWRRGDQVVRVQSEGDKTATVAVETAPKPPVRPIVLIEENGGWGVDLIETYAGWNNLQGVAKAEAIYKLTGVILDELPRTEARTRSLCQTNMRQIAFGISQYVQDYDERFPLAKGWTDNLQPYVKTEAIFNCPALPKGQKFGYAYNSKLSNKAEASFSDASKIVAVYETSILKRNAYGIGESLVWRHLGGANYTFANGRLRWFSQEKTPSFNIGNPFKRPIPAPQLNAPPPPV